LALSQAFVQADKTKHNLKSYRLRQARYEPDDKVLGLGVQIGLLNVKPLNETG